MRNRACFLWRLFNFELGLLTVDIRSDVAGFSYIYFSDFIFRVFLDFV